ncbi:MAG: DUF4116 domain-containing protein [Patescibacteria group bacterium]
MTEELVCPICREQGDILIDIGCPAKHSFHSACIAAWLTIKFSCPMCRQNLSIKIETSNVFMAYLEVKYAGFTGSTYYEETKQIFNNLTQKAQAECIIKDYRLFTLLQENQKTLDLCILVVKGRGQMLKYVPEELKSEELCRLALDQTQYAFEFIPDQLKTPMMCFKAVSKVPSFLRFCVPKKIITSEFLISLLCNDVDFLDFLPEELKTLKVYQLLASKNMTIFYRLPQNVRNELVRI